MKSSVKVDFIYKHTEQGLNLDNMFADVKKDLLDYEQIINVIRVFHTEFEVDGKKYMNINFSLEEGSEIYEILTKNFKSLSARNKWDC